MPKGVIPAEGSYALGQLAVLRLSGDDAIEWLQGQVTCDLRTLSLGGSIRGVMCRVTGTIAAILDIWRFSDSLLLLVDRCEVDAVVRRVEEMVILEDVRLEITEFAVVHRWGGSEHRSVATPELESSLDSAAPLVRSRSRIGRPGWDELVLHVPPAIPSRGAEWSALTLAAGEPEPAQDVSERTQPAELGPAFEAATISYSKGCYTGQEIVMRMHSRNGAAKVWHGLLLDEPAVTGETLFDDRGQSVGEITRSARHPELGYIAGAMLRRGSWERPIFLKSDSGSLTPVIVHPMPLTGSASE